VTGAYGRPAGLMALAHISTLTHGTGQLFSPSIVDASLHYRGVRRRRGQTKRSSSSNSGSPFPTDGELFPAPALVSPDRRPTPRWRRATRGGRACRRGQGRRERFNSDNCGQKCQRGKSTLLFCLAGKSSLAAGRPARQSSTLWSSSADLAVDGDPDTCAATWRSSEQRWWQVDLGEATLVTSIIVTVKPPPEALQKFTVFLVDLDARNRTQFKLCTRFNGFFADGEVASETLACDDGRGVRGRRVFLRDDRRVLADLKLCEVAVYGEPLERGKKVTMASILTNSHSFICIERRLCSPPSLTHGRTIVTEGEDSRQAAIFECSTGDVLWGQAAAEWHIDGR